MSELLIKSFVSLLLLCVLMYFILRIIQYYSKVYGGRFSFFRDTSVLKISDIVYVDSSSKVVNLKCHHRNYIILLGKNNDIIIDHYDTKKL